MRVWILDMSYGIDSDGRSYENLWVIDRRGKRMYLVDNNHRPNFYALEPINRKGVTQLGRKRMKVFGKPIDVYHMATDYPKRVADIARSTKIRTFNSDIYYDQVYCIDHDISPSSWVDVDVEDECVIKHISAVEKRIAPPKLDTLAFDFETYNNPRVPEPQPICMASYRMTGMNKAKIILSDNTRREIDDLPVVTGLRDVINKLDPDVITTYYGNAFDWEVWSERAIANGERLRIGCDRSEPRHGPYESISVNGRGIVDTYFWAEGVWTPTGRKGLKDVAEQLLKVERHNYDVGNTWVNWDMNNIDECIDYCKDDSNWLLRIAEEFALPELISTSSVCGIKLSHIAGVSSGRRVESLLMRMSRRLGELIPRVSMHNKTGFKGAETFPDLTPYGLMRNIADLDYSSMYPNLMKNNNVGPDSLVNMDYTGEVFDIPYTGHRFRASPDSIYRICIDMLLDMRKNAQTEHENKTAKRLSNSLYGYTGWARARWFKQEVAESTTALGRHKIRKAMRIAEELGCNIVYGHTDSILMKMNDRTPVDVLQDMVMQKTGLELKHARTFKRILFVGVKNNYAGITTDNDIIIKGLECIKRSGFMYARNAQRKVIECVLKTKDLEKEPMELASQYISELEKGHVYVDELVSEVNCMSVTDMTPQGCIAGRLGLESGTRVPFLILDGDGPMSSRAIMPDEYNDEELDIPYYVNCAANILSRVLSPLGYTFDEIVSGRKQYRLGAHCG